MLKRFSDIKINKKNILYAVLFLLIIGVLIYRYKTSREVTEVAEFVTIKDIVNAETIFVRNEEVIYKNRADNVKYLINDGERITKNGVIAEIYSSTEDAINVDLMRNIDERIETLKKLQNIKNIPTKEPEKIDDKINDAIVRFKLRNQNSDYSGLNHFANEVLYFISERQLLLNENVGYEDKIKLLTSERENILNKIKGNIESINSPNAGYFNKNVDGFEKIFDFNNLLNLKLSDTDFGVFDNKVKNDDSILGKINTNVNFYILCKINSKDVKKLDNKNLVQISLSMSSEVLPCELVKCSQTDNSEYALAIFSCSFMNNVLSSIRKDSASIILDEYSGLKVSKQSLHKKIVKKYTSDNLESDESITGIYVKKGKKIIFKQVDVLYDDENIAICRFIDSSENQDDNLQLGDIVIVDGMNLYDENFIE